MVTRASERLFRLHGNRVYSYTSDSKFFLSKVVLFQICAEKFLFVEDGAQDSNGEMGKVGGTLVKLQPAHDAMVGEVLRNFCFGDSKVFRKPWLDRIRAASSATAN